MIITFWKGVFVVDKPEEAKLARAGFELHEPTLCDDPISCRGCRARIGRRYWTTRLESAALLRSYCNPTALRVLKDHLKRIAQSRALDAKIDVPAPPGLSYKGYQRAGIAYAIQRKNTLFGDEMGLGKTVEALGFCNHVRPRTVLVVAPNTLGFNWEAEARKWLVDNYLIWRPRSSSEEVPQTNERLLAIVNYEKIPGRTVIDEDRKTKEGEKPKRKLIHTPLSRSLRRPWDVAIFDEAQYLKNPDSQRCQAVFSEGGLFYQANRNIFTTGTPIENYPKELWPVAAAICPQKFGEWEKFARRYCGLHTEDRNGRIVWVTTGATHLGELQQRLRSTFMVRRLKADVLKELPPKNRQLIVIEDEEGQWTSDPLYQRWISEHEEEYNEALARLEASRTEAEYRSAVKELDAASGIKFEEMSEYRHKVGLAKLPACLRCVDQFLEGGLENIVIFAHHQDVLTSIWEHYRDCASILYGDTDISKREDIVRDFQAGKKRVFVAGLRAAGVGITLTRSSTVAFFESDWNPAKVAQAEDRVHRIGQTKKTHIIQFALRGSLDVNMLKKILAKQRVAEKALDWLPESERLQYAGG